MEKTALIIIDMQAAMFASPDTPPFRGEHVLNTIRSLILGARSAGVPVIFVQHTTKDEFTEGTPTWQICSELQPLEGEPIVQKCACDSFYRTGLQELLQNLGVTRPIFCGMQTEFCVDTTCRRAFSLGYHAILVQDAHTTFDTPQLCAEQIIPHHNYILGSSFVQLKSAAELLEADFRV